MKANRPRSTPVSTLVFGAAFLVLGVVNLIGGEIWRGIGFGAIGVAAILGSQQAHALLGLDYERRWTALRVIALALAGLSMAAFVVLVARSLA